MSAPEMTRPQAVETARRMHAGDWAIPDIRRYLARRGHRVTWDQVKGWVDPAYAARRNERERIRKREAWRRKHDVQPHQYRARGDVLDLLLSLRMDDDLSYTALIVIARRFFGLEFTEYSIRAELLRRGVAKNPNKARVGVQNGGAR